MDETFLSQLEFKQADHYSLPRVKQFYKMNGMRAQAPKGDLVFIALFKTTIVGALRLSPSDGCYLLRSMCISAKLRHKGIGSALLTFLQPELAKHDCYCFPFTHLLGFYASAGFTNYEIHKVPEAIADKFNRYITNGRKIALMKHHSLGMLK